MAVNDAKANVKEAVRPYHRRDRLEDRLKDARPLPLMKSPTLKVLRSLLGCHKGDVLEVMERHTIEDGSLRMARTV
jgi:hypothetical protein